MKSFREFVAEDTYTKTADCPTCHGSGTYPAGLTCQDCEGSGKMYVDDTDDTGWVQDTQQHD